MRDFLRGICFWRPPREILAGDFAVPSQVVRLAPIWTPDRSPMALNAGIVSVNEAAFQQFPKMRRRGVSPVSSLRCRRGRSNLSPLPWPSRPGFWVRIRAGAFWRYPMPKRSRRLNTQACDLSCTTLETLGRGCGVPPCSHTIYNHVFQVSHRASCLGPFPGPTESRKPD